jgi:hypothetical protein
MHVDLCFDLAVYRCVDSAVYRTSTVYRTCTHGPLASTVGQGHILRQLAGRHASPVHQTPLRHLELQVGPDAPATLALQAPMEARAQLAQQASTNLGEAMVAARTAARASTGGML